ncbi:MAG: AraC family transcriptional regulator [Ginsengibacter sp.]
MNIYIKNMVCNRCILAVKQLMDEMDIPYSNIQLGEVALKNELTEKQESALKSKLNVLGFELLDDSKKRIIDKIKTVIIEQVHYGKGDKRFNFSEQLSSKLHKDYSYLSNLFSETEGVTIEKYMINQKIEKVKELIVYDELNLSEIADKLGYSSAAHLSAQFKKVTGLTPSQFRKMSGNKRKSLDQV